MRAPVEPDEVIVGPPQHDSLPCADRQPSVPVNCHARYEDPIVNLRVHACCGVELPEPAALDVGPVEDLAGRVPERPFADESFFFCDYFNLVLHRVPPDAVLMPARAANAAAGTERGLIPSQRAIDAGFAVHCPCRKREAIMADRRPSYGCSEPGRCTIASFGRDVGTDDGAALCGHNWAGRPALRAVLRSDAHAEGG